MNENSKQIVVVGGGPGGLETASMLARMGFDVEIIEKEDVIGGHLNQYYQLFPNFRDAGELTQELKERAAHPKIKISTGESLLDLTRNDGKFEILTSKRRKINPDAVVMATGFDPFEAERKEEFGYGVYPNVITSIELEKMFREQGKVTTVDGRIPERVGIVHCVGSRDEKVGNFYCSRICCICGVKQAIEIRKHHPETRVTNFYMDMRMSGQYFEELYRQSQERWGVYYVRGRISEAAMTVDGKIRVKAEDTLIAKPVTLSVDLLVLMVGIEASNSTKEFSKRLEIESDYGFFRSRDRHSEDQESPVDGLFLAGTAKGPASIKETLADARATAGKVWEYFQNN
ncbi:MAG: FAD-dependent oxidoreductase [Bacteroidales bacterium]|jgi:heterodisulfide reductase subunit A|nr:FAD-dependent oxidoreductase [Bacteroidales bacterium]